MKTLRLLPVAMLLASIGASAEMQWGGYAQTLHGGGTATSSQRESSWLAAQERLQLSLSHEQGGITALARPQVTHQDADDSMEWSFRELTLAGRAGPLDWRVGRQIFTWGVTDFWPVLDVINPYDYSIFRNFQPDDFKRPVTAAQLVAYAEGWELEAILMPVHEGFRLADTADDPWLFQGMRQLMEAGIPLESPPVPRTLSNAEGGMRLGHPVGDWSLNGYFLYGRDRIGQPRMFFDKATGMPLRVEMQYPRQNIAGFSAQGALGAELLRFEAAYYHTSDASGEDPFVRNRQVKTTVGWERFLPGDLNAHLQYIVETRLNQSAYEDHWAPGERVRPRLDHMLTLKLYGEYGGGRWRPYLFTFYRPQDDEVMANPQLGYWPADGFEAALGAVLFEGWRPDTLVGQFDANDYVYLKTTYFF